MSDSGILFFQGDSVGTMEQAVVPTSIGINDIVQDRFSKSISNPEPLLRAYGFSRSISPQQELQNLSEETKNIFKYFTQNNFVEVVRDLSTSNLVIRNLALSGKLPMDVTNYLDNLTFSLDACIEIIYKKLRELEPLEDNKQKEIQSFLEGIPELLMYFSRLE